MLHAYNTLIFEFVMLGLLSFLIETVGLQLTKICIPMYFPGSVQRWWVRCPVSYTVQDEESLVGDEGDDLLYFHCNPSNQPFISYEALHETHILLFLIGSLRVAAVLIIGCLSQYRLKRLKNDFLRIRVVNALRSSRKENSDAVSKVSQTTVGGRNNSAAPTMDSSDRSQSTFDDDKEEMEHIENDKGHPDTANDYEHFENSINDENSGTFVNSKIEKVGEYDQLSPLDAKIAEYFRKSPLHHDEVNSKDGRTKSSRSWDIIEMCHFRRSTFAGNSHRSNSTIFKGYKISEKKDQETLRQDDPTHRFHSNGSDDDGSSNSSRQFSSEDPTMGRAKWQRIICCFFPDLTRSMISNNDFMHPRQRSETKPKNFTSEDNGSKHESIDHETSVHESTSTAQEEGIQTETNEKSSLIIEIGQEVKYWLFFLFYTVKLYFFLFIRGFTHGITVRVFE